MVLPYSSKSFCMIANLLLLIPSRQLSDSEKHDSYLTVYCLSNSKRISSPMHQPMFTLPRSAFGFWEILSRASWFSFFFWSNWFRVSLPPGTTRLRRPKSIKYTKLSLHEKLCYEKRKMTYWFPNRYRI